MSRSRKDILDTENMLQRLTALLSEHLGDSQFLETGQMRADAESLRRISMTLRRWFELECGDGNNHGSWAIVRGRKPARRDGMGARMDGCAENAADFEHDDDGKPYLEHHHYLHGRGKDYVTHSPLPDRESGARRRLAQILSRYPTLQAYVQTDPRGCALYILRPGDVPEGADASSCYSRGLAVFQ